MSVRDLHTPTALKDSSLHEILNPAGSGTPANIPCHVYACLVNIYIDKTLVLSYDLLCSEIINIGFELNAMLCGKQFLQKLVASLMLSCFTCFKLESGRL